MTGNRRVISVLQLSPATSALKARKILPSMWALAKHYPVKWWSERFGEEKLKRGSDKGVHNCKPKAI